MIFSLVIKFKCYLNKSFQEFVKEKFIERVDMSKEPIGPVAYLPWRFIVIEGILMGIFIHMVNFAITLHNCDRFVCYLYHYVCVI